MARTIFSFFWYVRTIRVKNPDIMGTVEQGKSVKSKMDFRLDDDLIADLKRMAKLTGTDATAVVHDALRNYKESPELKAAIAKHQKDLAAEAASLSGHTTQGKDTGRKIRKIVEDGVKKARPV